jgi:SNF2 family DNA or RNA helicase
VTRRGWLQAFALALLARLAVEGHRVLVFSQSLGMLDMLQRALRHTGTRSLRLDGACASGAERQALVARFQRSRSISVFLLSAQARSLPLARL